MHDSIRISVHSTEDLSEQVRAAIIQVCVEAHGEPDFHNLFTYIPSGGLHVLAYDDGPSRAQLVGHAVVTERWMQPEGAPLLRTAYVDAVSTLPAYKGRGVGSAVMRRLADELGGFEIACLETEIAGFYTRLGWEKWRGPLAGRNEDSLIPTPDQTGILILRLPRTPPLDLDRGLVIECSGGRIW